MPPFLGCQCWYSFDDENTFPGAKAILLAVYVLICFLDFFGFVFETLKECIPDLSDVLCSDKT